MGERKPELAVDANIIDETSVVVIAGGPRPSSQEIATVVAARLHADVEAELGPAVGRPCTWGWYAYDGDEDHDRAAMETDLTEVEYAGLEELLKDWDEASRPIVAMHYQMALRPLTN